MRRLAAIDVAAACSAPPSVEPVTATPEPAAPVAAPVVADPYAPHLDALRARLAKAGLDDMHVRVEAPFVVAGNDAPDQLARRARTIRWAVDALERDFFTRRPTRTLAVFLWNDARSYRRGVRALTGDDPTTPYGFYASDDDGLFMDISTGGGTLVHELVHPYVEADFPAAPPWLNEGLGSLFEQSAEVDGHIVGLTNWRLAGLQAAILEDEVPSFRALTRMNDVGFYQRDRGTNYAQARYLLYYLQEHGLLVDFYRRFRAAAATDPTGLDTLAAVLGEPDLKAFQRRWQTWVLGLRFGG